MGLHRDLSRSAFRVAQSGKDHAGYFGGPLRLFAGRRHRASILFPAHKNPLNASHIGLLGYVSVQAAFDSTCCVRLVKDSRPTDALRAPRRGRTSEPSEPRPAACMLSDLSAGLRSRASFRVALNTLHCTGADRNPFVPLQHTHWYGRTRVRLCESRSHCESGIAIGVRRMHA
jgi:hypothetical protein